VQNISGRYSQTIANIFSVNHKCKKKWSLKRRDFWRSFGRSKHVWRLRTSADSVLFSHAGIVVEGRRRRRVLG
jgi:hypothetical protein